MGLKKSDGLNFDGNSGSIPSYEGQEGKILSNNGEELEWVEGYKPNLFNIKTNSEPITQKGWSCISYPTQNKLDKADVPSAYNILKDKLDNANSVLDNLATVATTTDGTTFYNTWFCNDFVVVKNTDNFLYKVLKEEFSDTSKWVKINDYPIVNNLIVGDNIFVYDSSDITVIINKADFSTVKIIDGGYTPKFIFNNEIYFYNFDSDLYKLKDINDENELEMDLVVTRFGNFLSTNNCRIDKIFKYSDGFYFFNTYSGDNGSVVACRASDLSDPSTYRAFGYWNGAFVENLDDKIILLSLDGFQITDFSTSLNGDYFQFDNIEIFENLNNLDLSEYTTYSVNAGNIRIEKHLDFDLLYFPNSAGNAILILKTYDYINFEKIFDSEYVAGSFNGSSYSNDMFIVTDTDYLQNASSRVRSAGFVKTVFVDTINGTDIKYYKNGDFKICTPDIDVSNDTNLQSVYEFLGYLNYWWIDEENEQISLQRNSNLWSMMFVGDDYEDNELPSGNYRKNKLVNELIEDDSASITIDVKGNQFYKFTNNAITDITIDSCEDSIEETTIQFTTGNSAPTLTDNSGLVWFSGIPTLQTNTTYVIVIFNKQAFYQEQGV